MLDKIFGGTTFMALEKSLEAVKLRNEVTAHNMANVDTPDFKRSYVEFEQYMMAAMQDDDGLDMPMRRTRSGHMDFGPEAVDLSGVHGVVFQDNSTTLRMDGNNVDVEHEMNEYNKNQVHYSTLIEQMNSEFRRIRTAIGTR